MAWELWLVYLAAVFGLAVTPGPNGLLALTHGALYGVRKTVFTVVGGVLGFACLIALAMFGLGALLDEFTDVLVIMKWLGGAYLLWLGCQLWRTPPLALAGVESGNAPANRTLFKQGLMTALANPKVLLFYVAFIPQFIDAQKALVPQFMVMALTYAAVEFAVEFYVAKMAHHLRPILQRQGNKFNRCCGTLFAVIGMLLPMTK